MKKFIFFTITFICLTSSELNYAKVITLPDLPDIVAAEIIALKAQEQTALQREKEFKGLINQDCWTHILPDWISQCPPPTDYVNETIVQLIKTQEKEAIRLAAAEQCLTPLAITLEGKQPITPTQAMQTEVQTVIDCFKKSGYSSEFTKSLTHLKSQHDLNQLKAAFYNLHANNPKTVVAITIIIAFCTLRTGWNSLRWLFS